MGKIDITQRAGRGIGQRGLHQNEQPVFQYGVGALHRQYPVRCTGPIDSNRVLAALSSEPRYAEGTRILLDITGGAVQSAGSRGSIDFDHETLNGCTRCEEIAILGSPIIHLRIRHKAQTRGGVIVSRMPAGRWAGLRSKRSLIANSQLCEIPAEKDFPRARTVGPRGNLREQSVLDRVAQGPGDLIVYVNRSRCRLELPVGIRTRAGQVTRCGNIRTGQRRELGDKRPPEVIGSEIAAVE